jgi:DMSO reductase anchor subunit
MRPALSVVAFTVLSGAGLGGLALVALADLASLLAGASPIAPGTLAIAGALSLVLTVLGLLSSTLHLGNPRNAVLSLARWRTSWLSREAIAALTLLPFAALLVALLWTGAMPSIRAIVDLAVPALAWTTLHCTSMIYASLKPIRQWHTRHVPASYLLLGHASGAVLLVAVLRADGGAPAALSLIAGVLLAAAAFVKLDYYASMASDAKRLTIEDAIGVAHGVAPPPARPGAGSVMRARLLDAGHSRGTFLTHEFGYTLAPSLRIALRAAFWLAGLAVPVLWLATGLDDALGAAVAVAACLAGLGAERWLFFAEARHTVRLYHGEATT